MQTFRSRCARLGAIGAAALLSVAGLSLMGALPAGATPPGSVSASLQTGASNSSASDGIATVTWTLSPDVGVAGYAVTPVLVATNLGAVVVSPPQPQVPLTVVVGPTATTATVPGLTAYDSYVFSVTAEGAASPATAATAAPVTVTVQTNYSFAGPTGFGQLSTAGAAVAPPTASQGSNFQVVSPGGGQVVPTLQSGVALNYIHGITQYYEIPANFDFRERRGDRWQPEPQ